METLLYDWIQDQVKKRTPLSLHVVQTKAVKIFKKLQETSEGEVRDFSASHGWFNRFKKRFQLRNVRVAGEKSSADEEAAREFIEDLHKLIADGNYSAEQIFNVDETALFWKAMPSRSYTTGEEN